MVAISKTIDAVKPPGRARLLLRCIIAAFVIGLSFVPVVPYVNKTPANAQSPELPESWFIFLVVAFVACIAGIRQVFLRCAESIESKGGE